ncbi:MAG TPA: GspH/FimT family pseudopilin [Trichocoleus sp.]
MKLIYLGCQRTALHSLGQLGFTLLETTIVMIMLAILMSTALPGFMGLWQLRCLTVAQDEMYQGMRLAQSNAMQNKVSWQFSLRDQGDYLEWAVHAQGIDPTQVPVWHPLRQSLVLDESDTTLRKQGNVYYVRFDLMGNINGQLGRVTLASEHGGRARRCVVASTLIGALRKGKEQPVADSNGRYCY